MLAIDPALFGDIQGSTDREVVFHLALTFGLGDDPVQALELAVGLIEDSARQRGIAGAGAGELRLIVSEPFSDLPGDWREIPQGTAVTVRAGQCARRVPSARARRIGPSRSRRARTPG